MKAQFSGQVRGTWLIDVRLKWWLRLRFRVVETAAPGLGPTLKIDLPWYHGKKILHFHLKVNALLWSKDIEWNVKAL